MHRAEQQRFKSGPPMPVVRDLQIVSLPDCSWRITRKFESDASTRPDIYRMPIFWKSTDVFLLTKNGLPGKPQKDTTFNAPDEIGGNLSRTQFKSMLQAAPEISLFIAKCGHYKTRSGLGYRHHLSSIKGRLCLSGSLYRLVQPVCIIIRGINNTGSSFLSLCTRFCIANRKSGNSQFRPGCSIYQSALYRCCIEIWNEIEHGWKRKSVGQCLYRTAVAYGKVRKYLPQGIQFSKRGISRFERLLRILQLPEASWITEGKITSRSL